MTKYKVQICAPCGGNEAVARGERLLQARGTRRNTRERATTRRSGAQALFGRPRATVGYPWSQPRPRRPPRHDESGRPRLIATSDMPV